MLSTYTGEKIPIYGTVDVCVSAKGKSTELPLTIVSGSGPTLLGGDWLNSINLDWPMINNIATEKHIRQLKKYSQVFDLTNTKPVKGIEAKIHGPSDAKPCYYKPRAIPYAITELINNEIDRLLVEGMGNIERASTSRSLVRIPISNESLYHATQKKNHGYSTSISMPTTRALIRAGIDSDVDQHRGHVCSKAATTRGVV